jgi:hypothetical protein
LGSVPCFIAYAISSSLRQAIREEVGLWSSRASVQVSDWLVNRCRRLGNRECPIANVMFE